MIQTSVEWLWLLAAWRTNWRDTFNGVYFQSNTDEVWAIFIVTSVLVAGLILWQLIASRAYGRFPSNSPHSLFRELCRTHGLDRTRRRLLKRLAVARGIAPPALLFVQPECFATTNLSVDLSDQAEEIAELGVRLFGELDAE